MQTKAPDPTKGPSRTNVEPLHKHPVETPFLRRGFAPANQQTKSNEPQTTKININNFNKIDLQRDWLTPVTFFHKLPSHSFSHPLKPLRSRFKRRVADFHGASSTSLTIQLLDVVRVQNPHKEPPSLWNAWALLIFTKSPKLMQP